MRKITLILFILPSVVFAKVDLSQIEINSKASLEVFKLMLGHLNQYPAEKYTAKEILVDFIKMNENLRGVKAKSTKSFLFSELYKTFFNFDQNDLIDAKNIHISGANIKVIETKLEKYKELLTPFATYLVQDMLKNYEEFQQDNYINNYLNTSDNKYDKPLLKKKIETLNKHVGPWLMLFSRYDSKKFNAICSKYIKNYFQTIAYLSRYFMFQKLSNEGEDIFAHPKMSLSKFLETANNPIQKSEEDEGKDSKSPEEDIKGLTVDPGDGAAPKIKEIIENLDQKKQ